MKQKTINLQEDCLVDVDFNRFEVVNESGRVYTRRDIKHIQLSVQDKGKTLKIFING